MNILKWTFGDYGSDIRTEAKEIIIGKNTLVSIGQYDGLQFNISGLGLTKCEREFFGDKFLHIDNIVNIYIGKLIISYDKRGYKDHLSSVNIEWEMQLKKYIKHYFKYTIQPKLKKKFNNIISRAAKKIVFRKKEVFTICESYSEPKTIKCDKLTAYQLASNYEADLIQNGQCILSPLGFEWKENKNLIVKNLGKIFNNFKLYGYSNWDDVEILK